MWCYCFIIRWYFAICSFVLKWMMCIQTIASYLFFLYKWYYGRGTELRSLGVIVNIFNAIFLFTSRKHNLGLAPSTNLHLYQIHSQLLIQWAMKKFVNNLFHICLHRIHHWGDKQEGGCLLNHDKSINLGVGNKQGQILNPRQRPLERNVYCFHYQILKTDSSRVPAKYTQET